MNAIKKQLKEMQTSIKSLKESTNRRMTRIEKKMVTLGSENNIPLITTESTEDKMKTFAEQMQAIEKSNEDKTKRIVRLEAAVKQLQEKENKREDEVKNKVISRG
jgi:phosphoenolpyruvate carboxylase